MKHFALAPITLAAASACAQVTTPSVTFNDPSGTPMTVRLVPDRPPTGPSGSASGVLNMPPATQFEINGAATMRPRTGYDTLRIKPATIPYDKSAGAGGAFRIACFAVKDGFFDPIVYPGIAGKSHLHTFFGNSQIDQNTGTTTLVGPTTRSSCAGGLANRSAYWVPSMINTVTGYPETPWLNLVYYKADYAYGGDNATPPLSPTLITTPVAGLRMIAGSPGNTSESNVHYRWDCLHATGGITYTLSMPGAECENGSDVQLIVYFPSCWDGVNLDSPNHQSHMAYASTTTGCPTTHPVPIPKISYNIRWKVKAGHRPENWRLSSDTYSLGIPAGRSAHGDWWNGWDQTVLNGIVVNCLQKGFDAHANLLCDGRTLF